MSKATGQRRQPQSLKNGKGGKKAQYFDEVIRLYYEEGLSGLEISKMIPVHNSNIYHWLDEYDLQQEGKESVAKKSGRGIDGGEKKAKRATGVKAPETNPQEMTETDSMNQTAETTEPLTEVEVLKKRIETLEKELKDKAKALRETEIKADLYNEIINVAEKKFNVPIRKKAGTKR